MESSCFRNGANLNPPFFDHCFLVAYQFYYLTTDLIFYADLIGSFYVTHVKLFTDRQTNRKTNKRQLKHNLLVGGSDKYITYIRYQTILT